MYSAQLARARLGPSCGAAAATAAACAWGLDTPCATTIELEPARAGRAAMLPCWMGMRWAMPATLPAAATTAIKPTSCAHSPGNRVHAHRDSIGHMRPAARGDRARSGAGAHPRACQPHAMRTAEHHRCELRWCVRQHRVCGRHCSTALINLTAVGFEPARLALVELESTPLDRAGKLS